MTPVHGNCNISGHQAVTFIEFLKHFPVGSIDTGNLNAQITDFFPVGVVNVPGTEV